MSPAPPSTTNGLALAALLVGIFGFCIGAIGGLIAVVLGILGLRRPGGKGMSIAGIILGVINIVVTLVVLGLFISGAAWFSSNADRLIGEADPSTYDISIDSCRISSAGDVTANGVITNTTSKPKNFLITVSVTDKSSGEVYEAFTTETDIRSREDRAYEATTYVPSSVRSVRCAVKEVRNAFN